MTLDEFYSEWWSSEPTVRVHTSGSTGKPKLMLAEKKRMEESARMTLRFLGLQPGDTALLCMPLDFIAGKMMVVRAIVGELRLIDVKPSGHPLADPGLEGKTIDFAAMVPLQVYNTLQVERERQKLREVRHLIIGGGAVDERLERQLAAFPNAVWGTYGMTETLSHIAMRRINGEQASPWYEPLPGVALSQNEEECLVIEAPRICTQRLETNDIVSFHDDGRRFRVVGRKDHVICSGGIKLQAEEVEDKLRPYIPFPFLIAKEKDEKYGEIAVLVVEGGDNKKWEEIAQRVLPKYWVPRKILIVTQLPRTATGKPLRLIQ